MNHSTSTRTTTSSTGQAILETRGYAIAGILVAGVMFVLGYTVVRAGLAQADSSLVTNESADVQVIVPGEGTLWADFGPSH